MRSPVSVRLPLRLSSTATLAVGAAALAPADSAAPHRDSILPPGPGDDSPASGPVADLPPLGRRWG